MATASTNGNGKPQLTLDEINAKRVLLEAQVSLKQLEVMESYLSDYNDFGGSDLFYQLRYRDSDGSHWVPPNVPSDRRHGGNWPMWRTDQELARFRQQSRMLCESNNFAMGTLRNLTNYTIGVGFTYTARLKDQVASVPGIQADEKYAPYAEAVQRVVDDFLCMNRWSDKVDPRFDTTATGNKHREGFRRVKRDGEAIIRFFFANDGRTYIRFVEPEQLWTPPAGVQEGWSYGIRHQMIPFEDVESTVEYYIVPQDPSSVSDEEQRKHVIGHGECVPAGQIVHIKGVDTDAAIKRGTPAFIWDTFDAFTRAQKLQRNMSLASAVRAATSEIWQHQHGTREQLSQLAAGFAERTRVDPVTQRSVISEKIIPGAVRRIPQGQELVPFQADPGASGLTGIVQGDLRQGIVGFCAPEYFTGDASNANYASTKEAGAPFVRASESEQEHFKQAYLRCVWKAVLWAVKCGALPEQVLDLVEIQVDAPKVLARDELQQAQKDQILVSLGAKSPQTVAVEDGLDWDTESQRIKEHQEQMGGTGGGGGDLGSIMQQMGGGGGGGGLRESLRESFDENKHPRADDGKFGSGGGGGSESVKKSKVLARWSESPKKKEPSGYPEGGISGDYFVLFHETPGKNIEQIKRDGLNKNENAGPRWYTLTDSFSGAEEYSGGDETRQIVKIKIPLTKVDEYLWPNPGSSEAYGNQYALKKPIPPSMIHDHRTIKESAEFDEAKHPRADDGKFGSGGGGSKSEEAELTKETKLRPKTEAEIKAVAKIVERAKKHFADRIESDLPAETVESYTKTLNGVIDYMTVPMLEKVMNTVGEVKFHETVTALTQHLLPGAKGKLAGAWSWVSGDRVGTLHLDGDSQMTSRQIYAHEIGHALDFNGVHSNSAEWAAAFSDEINKPEHPLSKYATTSHSEGFAEYFRLVITSTKEARTEFPKCWACLKKWGYL